tara:strand:+ start:276 stop:1463 length:1188 start_codon:yes stop_codon:yes gene_type:complete
MKKIYLFIFVLLVNTISHGAEKYQLESFENNTKVNASTGLTVVNDQYYLQTAINPNLRFMGAELGLGLNLHIPLEGGYEKPDDLEFVTIRYIGYRYKDTFGIKWGRLSNITFGYGLLMDNYDSGNTGSLAFSNKKAGVLGFVAVNNLRSDVMLTYSKVQAGRLSYRLPVVPLIGTPIVFGINAIRDEDGVEGGLRQAQMGYSVDAGVPIAGPLLTLYSEIAELKSVGKVDVLPLDDSDHKRGFAFGGKGNIFNMISYLAEYRYVQKDFIPGYFNSTYESTETPDPLGKDQHGFVAGIYTHLMDDYVKAGATYESITETTIASIGWKEISKTVGVINYTIPPQGRDAAILDASVLYLTGGIFDYVIHFKRQYYKDQPEEDSYAFSVRVNLDSFLPF